MELDVTEKTYQSVYESLGVSTNGENGNELITDCIFCGKENHLYINNISGLWDCKVCGRQGNFNRFLAHYYNHALTETSDDDYNKLAEFRQLPVSVLKHAGIAYYNSCYILPVLDAFSRVTDLRRYQIGRKFVSLEKVNGFAQNLLGLKNLIDPARFNEPIYVCEGEFDYLALTWLFKITNKPGIPVAVPGDKAFNKKYIEFFNKRIIVSCFDYEQYSEALDPTIKLYEKLKGKVAQFNVLQWPDSSPKGYDLNNFITAYGVKTVNPADCYNKLSSLIVNFNKKDEIKANKELEIEKSLNIQGRITFGQVMEEYKNALDINKEYEDLIKICLATVISVKIPGDCPVWNFIVGPPGYGKTEILISLKDAIKLTYYQSSLKRTSLISGFATPSGADPSILPKINGKCLVIKDYTLILDAPQQDQKITFGVLRDAFDGEVNWDFSNNITRNYKSKFAILAGVTKVIQKHSQATVGERFLRFFIDTKNVDYVEQQTKAVNGSLFGSEHKDRLRVLVKKFLQQDWDFTPERLQQFRTNPYFIKIIHLAKLAAILQTQVDRHEFGLRMSHMAYDPEAGSGNRLTTQLSKIAIGLAVIQDKELDREIYDLVKKNAFDTVYGYQTRIIDFIVKKGLPQSKTQMRTELNLQNTNLNYALNDLIILGLVKMVGQVKHATHINMIDVYYVSEQVEKLWKLIE